MSAVTAGQLALNIVSFLGATIDDGSTNAVFYYVMQGGPEDLPRLFNTVDCDCIAVIGEPSYSSERVIQDSQEYDVFDVPVKLIAINKYSGGSLISTAPLTLRKFVDALVSQVNISKHGTNWAATPMRGEGSVVRRAGMDFHEFRLTIKVKVML